MHETSMAPQVSVVIELIQIMLSLILLGWVAQTKRPLAARKLFCMHSNFLKKREILNLVKII